MTATREMLTATEKSPVTAGHEFARRFTNTLCELRLPTGLHHRIARILSEFAEEHPNLRGAYISRAVDKSYFSDSGWETATRPKLQGIAIEGENLFEFLAFAKGFRSHCMPLSSVTSIEELWLESPPEQPVALRICLHHSFSAATILYAPDGETQEAALAFLRRLKYLRGF